MRVDAFADKRCIHFKISKDVHLALRAKLFKYDISMQLLFDEFARLVATDSPKAQSIINLILNKRIKSTLANSPLKKKRPYNRKETLSDIDTEALYNMINEMEDQ